MKRCGMRDSPEKGARMWDHAPPPPFQTLLLGEFASTSSHLTFADHFLHSGNL